MSLFNNFIYKFNFELGLMPTSLDSYNLWRTCFSHYTFLNKSHWSGAGSMAPKPHTCYRIRLNEPIPVCISVKISVCFKVLFLSNISTNNTNFDFKRDTQNELETLKSVEAIFQ